MTTQALMPTPTFSIDEDRQFLTDFETNLNTYVPNPTNRRLMQAEVEYQPIELAGMLQEYGSYVANLSALEGKMMAEDNIYKKGYKESLRIAVAGFSSGATSVSGKEAEFLASDEGAQFRNVYRILTRHESCLMMVRGWLKSYESAYTAVSRVVTVVTTEQENQ